METEIKLESCPFCGSNSASPMDDVLVGQTVWHIECFDCNARTGEYANEQAACLIWNCRDQTPFAKSKEFSAINPKPLPTVEQGDPALLSSVQSQALAWRATWGWMIQSGFAAYTCQKRYADLNGPQIVAQVLTDFVNTIRE